MKINETIKEYLILQTELLNILLELTKKSTPIIINNIPELCKYEE